MRNILTLVFTLVFLGASAQWDKNGGIIFLKWGYQGGSTKVDNYFYETNPTDVSSGLVTQQPTMTYSQEVKYKNKALFAEVETVQRRLIFGMRFGFGLKTTVPGLAGFTMRDATYFNAYFGYGFNVKTWFSIIPTLRYNWSFAEQQGSPTLPAGTSKYFATLGGNQRGLGLNAVVPVGEKLLVRAGYYYEWIFRAKKAYKGLALTPEVELYYPFDDDHTFGLAFKVAMPNRKMYDNYNANSPQTYQPETSFKSFIWEASISIPLPSASTTTYVITVVD